MSGTIEQAREMSTRFPTVQYVCEGWNEDSYGKTPTVTRNIYEEKGTAKQPKK